MRRLLSRARAVPLALALLVSGGGALAAADTIHTDRHTTRTQAPAAKPTIVLVHGAFADSSSWSGEIASLQSDGYPVLAIDNPLRGVAFDTAYITSVLKTIPGPVVLVGHSYGGMLIGQAAAESQNVRALVYVAAYMPKVGESAGELTAQFPGSELGGKNLTERPFPGGTDVYVTPSKFQQVYSGGLSKRASALAAAIQEPLAAAALTDKETIATPAGLPKWQIVARQDHAIPPKTELFMAHRAKARIVEVNSGHDVPAVAPAAVTRVILSAAHTIR
jgi:pimeloyl-ACP methyl ester carboxylesterase